MLDLLFYLTLLTLAIIGVRLLARRIKEYRWCKALRQDVKDFENESV